MSEQMRYMFYALNLALGILLGICVLYTNFSVVEGKYKGEAIERGFAEYNSKTGKWQWKAKEVEGE